MARSTLETQKLELMSTISEYKLQLAAMERENYNMRSSQINNNQVNTMPTKRPPVGVTGRSFTTSVSSLTGSLHESLGSQTITTSPATPKVQENIQFYY